ncbi:hypothetical protein [Myxococcus sp. CA040A]|uniref:hypothetical protein n=1 Tax=Myxococcus sp. CA040A TaxID=2741738 RepID=UPI00157ABDD6|nr:hypothetical protein [Myxococcus sp. CA040A]NTX06003.1 hypothetical protein [Myxococcus sp. CA040A]
MTAKAAKRRGGAEAESPKKVAVATAPEREAHHATLREAQCTDCAVGLLRQYVSASLRRQGKADPGNRRFHLKGDEALEFSRTTPLALQLVGLRRERGVAPGFEDLLLVLYDPALLVDAERPLLDAEGLREANLEDTQAYVDAVLEDRVHAPPRDWPFPGVNVSCPKCKHWRVAMFPLTTETGHSPEEAARGTKSLHLSAIAPGLYNAHFRVAPHEEGAESSPAPRRSDDAPPEKKNQSNRVALHEEDAASPVLRLSEDAIPVRRRHLIAELLKSAQAAHDQETDEVIRVGFLEKDTATRTSQAGSALNDADASVTEPQSRTDAARVAEHRKRQAVSVFEAFKARLEAQERCLRLEDANGTETRDFTAQGNALSHLEVVEDETAPMKSGLRCVFKTPPSSPPRTLRLTAESVLVTLGTTSGAGFHPPGVGGSGVETRQVFRSSEDFKTFLRMAVLSKRALCPARQSTCTGSRGCPTRIQDLEPCDFGACGFRFDYVLAETTRANMEALVSRLGGPDWDALFASS